MNGVIRGTINPIDIMSRQSIRRSFGTTYAIFFFMEREVLKTKLMFCSCVQNVVQRSSGELLPLKEK